ncbi:MAG: NrfD/PsrC family molybdoenzyme membrane anchor subunit [Chloroflexota bacterium]
MFRQRLSFLRNPFVWWVSFLLLLIVSGLVAAVVVFTRGLYVTNLTDLVPWGLWIGIDLSSIALAAGAFSISAIVYLLKVKKLLPVAKTAVFLGLIGYTMAVLTLLLDIGRPDRFWHAMAYWNIHSPLWEVTMCVTLYLAVLTLEVTPIVGNSDIMQNRWPKIGRKMGSVHKLAPVLAVVGLCLSMMHQTSLGVTYGVIRARPAWDRSSLAVLFIVSAVAAGPAMVIFASHVAARMTSKAKINQDLLNTIAKYIGWVLIVYLFLRVWDLLYLSFSTDPGRGDSLFYLTQGPLAVNFWLGEMIIGIIIPIIILLVPRWRQNPRLQMLAAAMVVIGLILYRWDTNMVGQMVVFSYLPQATTPLFTSYLPSFVEIAAGLGVVAYGILAFTLGVRYLRVVDHTEVHEHETAQPMPVPMLSGD